MTVQKSLLSRAIAVAASVLVAGSAFAADYTLKLHHLLGPKAPAHTKMLGAMGQATRRKDWWPGENRHLSGDVVGW